MDILAIAESFDGYRYRCLLDPLNKSARSTHSYSQMSSEIQDAPYNAKIVQLYPTADAGLPHTRPPNLICVPAYYPMNNETLLHELLHLHQRNHSEEWESKFKMQGWEMFPEQFVPDRWRHRCRLNPDTLSSRFYSWENRWIPLPMFEREDKPDLRHCVVRWWDQKSGSLTSDPPSSFVAAFGKNHPQPEHPREVSAVILARQFHQSTWDELESHLPTFLRSN
jgi:hypothetical protein